ncbi:hypothetical protein [Actinoplanes sp. ATCC 53533]|nr:hypothetical protein [Actinoplanes sp. ATCC 53533]
MAQHASARGMASELGLVFYGRVPVESLKLNGDRLIARDPDA